MMRARSLQVVLCLLVVSTGLVHAESTTVEMTNDEVPVSATEGVIEESGCPPTVTDIDGNVYRTVLIGDQCWIVENLKVVHYRNGDAILHAADSGAWSGLAEGACCEYDNDSGNVETYGRLYNWHAVTDERGIAPEGWHVATDDEWKQLEVYLGMSRSEAESKGFREMAEDVGGKLKDTGTSQWISPNASATNESGFSAMPGGFRNYLGHFNNMGFNGYFWSSTAYDSLDAWSRYLYNDNSGISRYHSNMQNGLSVRCVRD
jgi:uncharacterized protein (TIGR02145 family)